MKLLKFTLFIGSLLFTALTLFVVAFYSFDEFRDSFGIAYTLAGFGLALLVLHLTEIWYSILKYVTDKVKQILCVKG